MKYVYKKKDGRIRNFRHAIDELFTSEKQLMITLFKRTALTSCNTVAVFMMKKGLQQVVRFQINEKSEMFTKL
jgi:hypothetical protein